MATGKGNDLQRYFNQFKGDALLTKEQEQQLLDIIHQAPRGEKLAVKVDDPLVKHAYDTLILKNMRLILNTCLKFCSDINDPKLLGLVSAGVCGLVRALEKFDSTKGFRLSTYSLFWLRDAILDELNWLKPGNRIYKSLQNKYQTAYRLIRKEESRTPSKEEIYAFLNWDHVTIIRYEADGSRTKIPLDILMSEETQWDDPHLEVDAEATEEAQASRTREITALIRTHLATLEAEEQVVLSALFGIERQRVTLKELCEETGMSRMVANHHKNKGMRALHLRVSLSGEDIDI